MNIKVQCNCGAKFSFDVEPVNGQMPCAIVCPQCNADATAAANDEIAANLALGAAVPQVTKSSALRVAISAAPPKSAAPPAPTAEAPVGQFCSRHPRKQVQSHCYVCSKPICMECMQVFGYLCSATCRYQAEQQRIQVPTCEFKKSVANAKDWRKVGAIIVAIMVLLMGLAGFWAWFAFVGSHPKLYYSVKSGKDGWFTHAQFLDTQHILVADEKQIALHDIDANKIVWTREFTKDSGVDLSERPKVFLTPENIWVGLANSVLRLDRKNGDVVTKIALAGFPTSFQIENGELRVACRGNKETVTHIDLSNGAAKTEEIALTRIARTTKKRDFSQADPTAGVLTEQELNDPIVRGHDGARLIGTGDNLVELQVRMVEEHFTEVQSIKRNSGPSKINENLSAGSPAAPVAEEVLNEISRNRGGGFKTIDESRYAVTVVRRNAKDAPEWHGDVTGPPCFFSLKTVDVLTAGKGIWIFDKKNKLLKEDKLAYPIAELFAMGFGTAAPCFETDDTLFFFDKGVLTAFALPTLDVRWRVISVGISSLQNDGHGGLYACTTTASPEDIQYSDQIKLQDPSVAVLMKVDAKSGKVLWKARHLGVACFLPGKYVYAMNQQVRGPSLAIGLSQALGSGGGGSSQFRLCRVDPDSGKEIWDYYHEGIPEQLDFNKNRILLQFEDRVLVLKFLTL